MPPKSIPSPVKAPESVVSRLLAKTLKVAASDSPTEVVDAYLHSGENPLLRSLLSRFSGVYTWATDVANDVMRPDMSPLATDALSMPGYASVAKDKTMSGSDSLWLVVGSPSDGDLSLLRKVQHRGLMHSFRLPDGEVDMVFAIQLSSLEP